MLRKLIGVFFLSLPLMLIAQEMPFRVSSSTNYSVSGMIGKVEVDSTKYYQFRIIQELAYKKIGMGFDLDFLFDKDYRIKKSDWDHIEDFLNKIYYVRYGNPDDLYFAHFGGFPKHSVRNGLVMHNYSNMLFYPDQRNNGLLLGVNPNLKYQPQIELFSSDVLKLPIFYMNAHYSPIPDAKALQLREVELGAAFFSDRNQKANLKYTLGDSLYHAIDRGKSDALTILSFDYHFPVIKTEDMVIGNYAEIAHILDNGIGLILPGVYADLGYLKVNLEYRVHGNKFIPGYFDDFYEEERCVALMQEDSTYVLITKEDILNDLPAAYGFYGRVEGLIGKRLKAMIAWQNMYGEELTKSKSLWFQLWVDTRYKRLENVSFSYSKTRVDELSLGNIAVPRAQMSGSFTLNVHQQRRWFLIGKYTEKYKDKEGGINWWKDTKRSVSIGAKFTF